MCVLCMWLLIIIFWYISLLDRRLKYIMKHTPSRLHQKRTSTNFTNSKNRVWVASSSEGEQTSSKQTGQQGSGESKSRRGNKVWVANCKSPTKKTSATSLVLLGGKKYMMDNSKRRLKRTSSSSVPRLSSTSSAGKLVSVKNYLARYMMYFCKLYSTLLILLSLIVAVQYRRVESTYGLERDTGTKCWTNSNTIVYFTTDLVRIEQQN